MKLFFDLDNTLCMTSGRDYYNAAPILEAIKKVNSLYDDGNEITIYTARGSTSGIDHINDIAKQLSDWGLKYHHILKKPSFDMLVDDKAMSASEWRSSFGLKIVGFVASSFDLLHAGHCLYLQDAKSVCDYLIAGLHEDPTLDRPSKNKPIQSLDERLIQLRSVKYVDEVIVYKTECELSNILSKLKPDIRILGSDAIGKPITGGEYCRFIHYHNRNHKYSSSELRNRIRNGH